MPGDALIREINVPTSRRGIWDGLDATSDEYPADAMPEAENIRTNQFNWLTRKGMTSYKTLPGSGSVRLLADHYEEAGTRIRLAAQGTGAGGALYDLKEGTDSGFNATSGGTALGGTAEAYFHCTTLGDACYLTDRAGALRKYQETPVSGNQVRSVAQPVAPVVMPGVKARPYDVLETWAGSGGTSLGWTESDASKYALTNDTTANPPPVGYRTARLRVVTAAATGQTIKENNAAESLNSGTIHFWAKQTRNRYHQAFQFGLTTPADFSQPIRAAKPNEWYPVFIDVGTLPTINFKRFIETDPDSTVSSDYVTQLFLPGLLDGQYRWIYTHYDPTTGRESAPSPVSNSGSPLDLSTIGITGNAATATAMNKSAVLTFTSDSGTDSSTTQIRIYRNGGVPALTVDSNGREVWCRVGTVADKATTLSSSPAAAATSFTVTSATSITVGDTLVLDKGGTGGSTNSEETVKVTVIAGSTITVKDPLIYGHTTTTSTVAVAFLDNVANEAVDRTLVIQRERDDPPSGSYFVQKSPDGRLWLFGPGVHVAVSNRATPDRPTDYEVFPNGVDPLTRRDLLQGWRFEIDGDISDELLMWGGFYQGRATVLTRSNLYIIDAQSQADWGPFSIQRVAGVGCIARDSVAEVNGVLYWVTEGPRVVRWTGQGQPESVSAQRVSARLAAAPTAYWSLWFARAHAQEEGHYYKLWFVPEGGTTPTDRLDYNADQDAWEKATYRDALAVKRAWAGASVRSGGSDFHELYAVSTAGVVYALESGDTDAGVAIRYRFQTRQFPMQVIGMLHSVYTRANDGEDTVSLVCSTGGSEYGDQTETYSLVFSGTGDEEVKQRTHRTLLGRWAQLELSGDVSNRLEIHDLRALWTEQRSERASA